MTMVAGLPLFLRLLLKRRLRHRKLEPAARMVAVIDRPHRANPRGGLAETAGKGVFAFGPARSAAPGGPLKTRSVVSKEG